MANGDLQSIISGTNPTAVAQLQAYQQQEIANAAANPAGWGWGGGLARQIALGQGMTGAQNAVQQNVQANLAAQPSLAAMLASPDPMAAAASPGVDPLAQARVISAYGTPTARDQLAQAGLYGAQTGGEVIKNAADLLNYQAYLGRSQAGGAGGGVTPVNRAMMPGAPAPGGTAAIGSGRPDTAPGSTPLPIDPTKVPLAKLPAFMNALRSSNPAQYQQAMAVLRNKYPSGIPAAAAR